MDIKKGLKGLGIVIVTAIVLLGCSLKDINIEEQKGEDEMGHDNTQDVDIKEDKQTEQENQEGQVKDLNYHETLAFETDLEEHDSKMFEIANAWTNGDMFDCTWRMDNIDFEDGVMKMTIDSDGEDASPKWSGAEYRSWDFYSYGLFEVRMKPIKNDGLVSSFFTYTGPSDNNPWDEIDIEFLGKDTSKMQLNYFTNGVGNHEYIYDLGFDASEEFHTYGFEWLPESITWFVDGQAIYTAKDNIPSTPSKLMMNVWPGIGVNSWLKAFDGNVPLTAEYEWIRVTQYDIIEEN